MCARVRTEFGKEEEVKMSIFSSAKEFEISQLTLTDEQKSIIQEYCFLVALNSLSEQEARRLGEILEIAKTDPKIHFWTTEADHFMGHKLNLINETECRNFQAKLREYMVTDQKNFKEISF